MYTITITIAGQTIKGKTFDDFEELINAVGEMREVYAKNNIAATVKFTVN